MTNYEYILGECKKAYRGGWEILAVQDCVDRLPALTREELLRLFTSRWLGKKDEVRQVIFALLFQEQIEKRRALIRDATIDELGAMLTEVNWNYVKDARVELKQRYQRASHDTQMRIIGFFKRGTTKQDVKWGEVREKWQQRGFANPPSIFDSWKQ